MSWWLAFKHWLLYGDVYQVTSGPIVVVGLLTIYRKHQCHVRWCPLPGRHRVADTDWVVCRHHHPQDQPRHYMPDQEDVDRAADS